MIQLIVIAGLAVASFWSCSSPSKDERDADVEGAVDHDGIHADDADAIVASDTDLPDTTGDQETGIDTDSGIWTDADLGDDSLPEGDDDAADDLENDGDAFIHETPDAPAASSLGSLPCAFPGSLGLDAAGTAFVVSCGGASNALFRSSAVDNPSPWSQLGAIGGYPSHHIALDQRYYAAAHSYPDGVTILDAVAGAATAEVDFASTSMHLGLTFTPNTPAGMVLASGKLCIATSNMDHIDSDPALTTYFPGTIICMPWNGDGTVDMVSAQAFTTSGVNPTGMALIDTIEREDGTQRFAVLSSNSYANEPATQAALEICSAPSMDCTAIPLGAITAQMTPKLHVTEDGIAIVGVQKPAAGILGVDTISGAIAIDRPLIGIQNFIAAIDSWDDVATVSDFGIFGVGGSVFFVNVDPEGWTGAPATALEGSAGPSIVASDTLYQSVTSNDGTAGSLWKMDLSDLH